MNSTFLLTLLLLGITQYSQLSSCMSPSTLTDRSVMGANLLLRARERFSVVQAQEENSTTRWDAALTAKNFSIHRELVYICTHIAYLDMVSISEQLPTLPFMNMNYTQYVAETHKILCRIWVCQQKIITPMSNCYYFIYLLCSTIQLPVGFRRSLISCKLSEVDVQAICSQEIY